MSSCPEFCSISLNITHPAVFGHSVLGWEPEILGAPTFCDPRGIRVRSALKSLGGSTTSRTAFPCRGVIVGTEQFIHHASVAQIHNTIGTGGTHPVMRDHQDVVPSWCAAARASPWVICEFNAPVGSSAKSMAGLVPKARHSAARCN